MIRKSLKRYKFGLISLVSFTVLLAMSHETMAWHKVSDKKTKKVTNPQIYQISDSIYQVGYKNKENGLRIAEVIYRESKRHNIDPSILVAIIMAESSFEQDAVSETGDISIAQINMDIWNKEFERIKHEPIDEERLSKDMDYAIDRMAEILEILAKRHKTKKDWYGYYHSATPEYKLPYVRKIHSNLAKINQLDQKRISYNY
jgi:hypothetical protein